MFIGLLLVEGFEDNTLLGVGVLEKYFFSGGGHFTVR